jgi:hypothetical protein
MRILAFAVVALIAVSGCGAGETVGGSSSTPTGAVEQAPDPSTGEVASDGLPPPFTLGSAAGTQVGVQSTYCITGPSSGACADYVEIGPPGELSVVRPGETVQLVFEGAESAEGVVSVYRLGRRKKIASIELAGPSTSWTVDLEPGSYELEVFAIFATESTSGDTSASLGVLVDDAAAVEIVPAPDSASSCGQRS